MSQNRVHLNDIITSVWQNSLKIKYLLLFLLHSIVSPWWSVTLALQIHRSPSANLSSIHISYIQITLYISSIHPLFSLSHPLLLFTIVSMTITRIASLSSLLITYVQTIISQHILSHFTHNRSSTYYFLMCSLYYLSQLVCLLKYI